MDIVDLREFYATRLGSVTRRLISARLKHNRAGLKDAKVMGLGYAMPYLADCFSSAEVQVAFVPMRQGVFRWPEEGAVQSALVDECELPLLESAIDIALVIHALELTDAPEDMLKEIWRVLAPQGRLILAVPNRRGLWARFDSSPFGHGQPFSRPQLTALLRKSQFSVVSWSHALYFPPSSRTMIHSAASTLESIGSMIMPAISGVIMVEAVKQVYATTKGKRVRQLSPRSRPGLVPVPSRRNLGADL